MKKWTSNQNSQNRKSFLDSSTCSSVPYCSIRFSPIYLASLIYFTALQLDDDCNVLIEVADSSSINLMESDEKKEKKFKKYLWKLIKTNKKINKTERNIFDIEFLAKNCEASMKVYTDNYYQTIAASLFGSDEINDEDKTKLTERIQYPLEKNMININDVKKTNNDSSESKFNDKAKKLLNIQTKLEINHNSDSMPKTAMPVGTTTFQNIQSQNAVETIIGATETPIDQPNIHHIDNSTANNNTSDSTIDNDTNNQLETAKILKTITIPIPIPKFPHQ